MALFTPSCLISEIRGSVGTSNFSKNAYGPIVRQKLTQTNPHSTRQTTARNNFAAQVQKWQQLTQEQRDYYIYHARHITLKDSLGVSYRPTGYSLFISRSLNLSLIDWPNPPTIEAKPQIFGVSNLRVTGTGAAKLFEWDVLPGTTQWKWIVSVSAPFNKTVFKLNPSWLRFGLTGFLFDGSAVDLDALYLAAYNQGFPNIPDLAYFFGLSYVNITSGYRTPTAYYRYYFT